MLRFKMFISKYFICFEELKFNWWIGCWYVVLAAWGRSQSYHVTVRRGQPNRKDIRRGNLSCSKNQHTEDPLDCPFRYVKSDKPHYRYWLIFVLGLFRHKINIPDISECDTFHFISDNGYSNVCRKQCPVSHFGQFPFSVKLKCLRYCVCVWGGLDNSITIE